LIEKTTTTIASTTNDKTSTKTTLKTMSKKSTFHCDEVDEIVID
jgi:hypothetical protein